MLYAVTGIMMGGGHNNIRGCGSHDIMPANELPLDTGSFCLPVVLFSSQMGPACVC